MSLLTCDGVLGGIFLGQRPKPLLRFGGLMLKEAQSLSNYGTHGRCINQVKKPIICGVESDRPHKNQSKVNWTMEHETILLGLFIKHVPTTSLRHILPGFRKEHLRRIVEEFNDITGSNYKDEYLKDHLCELVTAIDYEWNAHVKRYSRADCDGKEIKMPYLGLFKEVCGGT